VERDVHPHSFLSLRDSRRPYCTPTRRRHARQAVHIFAEAMVVVQELLFVVLLVFDEVLGWQRAQRCGSSLKMISERQIPQYVETMRFFEPRAWRGPRENVDLSATPMVAVSSVDGTKEGHLIYHSEKAVFQEGELDAVVRECEAVAGDRGGWTTSRHANYPTTDIPLAELPEALEWFRNDALPSVVYPYLARHYAFAAPNPNAFRVVDSFVVKYNATNGQRELKPHRDGSVVSFNIALNSLDDYQDGGTWFDGLGPGSVRSDKGHLLSHASGMLHGGNAITAGVRYILVAFVILQSYPDWAVRWYNHVRNK